MVAATTLSRSRRNDRWAWQPWREGDHTQAEILGVFNGFAQSSSSSKLGNYTIYKPIRLCMVIPQLLAVADLLLSRVARRSQRPGELSDMVWSYQVARETMLIISANDYRFYSDQM